MNFEDVKKDLDEIRTGSKRIHMLRSKAAALRLSCAGSGIRYDNLHVQTSPQNYFEQAMAEAADADTMADSLEQDTIELKAAYLELIRKLESQTEQSILIMFYFNGLSIRRITDDLDIPRNTVWRTKNKGINNLTCL